MATFYPSIPPADIPSSELKIWQAFRALSDEWRVFHSVRWQSIRGGRQGDGEADFLLVHRQHGLIVLEVKGGDISIVDGGWFSTNREGTFPIKNPFEQALASKYALVHHLKTLRPPLPAAFVSHAVAFPDITVEMSIGMFGPRELVLDRGDVRFAERALKRVAEHWGVISSLSNSDLERITRLLAPTVRVRRTLRDDVEESQRQLIELTKQQVSILKNLRTVRKAVVLGGAGTGKTILAREKACQLAGEGLNVLLTCFNAGLAQYLRNELKGNKAIRVCTFHALCFEECRKAHIQVPSDPDADWWEHRAANSLVDAATVNGTSVDAVVVDEGQDFASDWIQALLVLSRQPDQCAFYMFADGHQDLYCRGWAVPGGWPTFHLDLNCRNTRQIAKRVSRIFSDNSDTLGAQGPEPIFLQADLRREGVSIVQNTISRLLREESLRPSQMVVLSNDTALIGKLRETIVEDHVFCGLGRSGIVAESISRFKGLESDVVILALTDQLLSDAQVAKGILYVALSRPRVLLHVLGSDRLRKFLGW